MITARVKLLSIACSVLLVCACSSTPQPGTAVAPAAAPAPDAPAPENAAGALYYSPKELKDLDLCAGYANVAMLAAIEKQHGKSIQDVKAKYQKAADAPLYLAVVDETYRANINSPAQFGKNYFNSCAQRIANIEPKRLSRAKYCMSAMMLSEVIWSAKKKGETSDSIYKHISTSKNKMVVSMIVKDLYSHDDDRVEEATMRTWGNCIHSFKFSND